MGPDGRLQKPGTSADVADAAQEEPVHVPRGVDGDRAWPLRDPMRQVRYDREQAAMRIGRSMRAWRKASGNPGGAAAAIPQGGGAALDGGLRQRMEGQLGADLSDAKIHTSGQSAQAAEGMGAKAFTVGKDVHFGAGEFAPGTKQGDRLLAHELTHVVQGQKSGVQRKPEAGEEGVDGEHGQEVSQPGEPAEQEADQVADGVAERLHDGGGDKEHAKPDQKEAAPPIARKAQQAPTIRETPTGIALGRKSGKEKADDIPSWASGAKMLPGETPVKAADRVMKQRFPNGDYPRGPGSEFNKIKKYFERK